MDNLAIETTERGVFFRVKVIPSSSRTMIGGVLGEMLKVRVSAAAEKGRANQCLIKFLAKQLGVKKGAVKIISGQTSEVKGVEVLSVTVGKVKEKLGL